ncbi:RASF4 protein, partial [Amia calva]|nr:RASF4 protein [Amia calva]
MSDTSAKDDLDECRKMVLRPDLLNCLDTYNCYHRDRTNLQLRCKEVQGQPVVEGMLTISWELRNPIRLQIQVDKFQQIPTLAWGNEHSTGMTRWREYPDLLSVDEEQPQGFPEDDPGMKVQLWSQSSETMRALLHRGNDAILLRRGKSQNDLETLRNTPGYVNEHLYNYKTSVFTPQYGQTSNISTDSSKTTPEVITQILQKYKIQNSPEEFELYIVRATGETKRIKDCECPLLIKVMNGPDPRVARISLMDKGQGKEVGYDVAQYLNFELPELHSILKKLDEEEQQLKCAVSDKYERERLSLSKLLREKLGTS